MTDRGSFRVQSDALRQHAVVWETHATHTQTAIDRISGGIRQGADFGVLAGMNNVSAYYDEWTGEMDQALRDAKKTFAYLHAALVSVANDYDGTDSTVATDFATLDPMNDLPR